MYLLSTTEIWEQGSRYTVDHDNARSSSRQLDYYKKNEVTTTNKEAAKKTYNGTNHMWWIRSAISYNNIYFYTVDEDGYWYYHYGDYITGPSPAFRIG